MEATFQNRSESLSRLKRYYFMAVIVISTSFLFSCNDVCSCKKVSCPAYNNTSFDLWLPYQSSQKIVFTDTAHRLIEDTIDINDVSARQAYEANKGCIDGDAGCSSDKYIYSPELSASYNSSSDWSGTTTDSNYTLSLHDFSVTAKGIGGTGFINTSFPSVYYNNLTLNGKIYESVQTIYRTDTAGAGYDVYQVYLKKGTGLIAWRSQYANTLFVLK